ncbi:alpha/beta hydrolase [Solicola gregarius]|uniref:Alpha/beta hydrolase n=1 Tax=Solicola gregarius TaxID=2908642 RepID=A0AA46YM72_9ACTN|nr:alpha/beta hydrolase [Solicola gregarius]UYM07755.1 alpha/beta hydrolase [Solicola gregarius]
MTHDPRAVLSRPAPPPDLVLTYGQSPEHIVDVHLPPGDGVPAPLVVVLHGGFWRDSVDRVYTRSLADALRRDGYAVATPEYRRTPAARWPEIRADIEAVRATLPSLIADAVPGRVEAGPYRLLGHSAGGHLALWWGLTAPRTVDRVVALAPVADLASAYADDLDEGAVVALLGGSPDDRPEEFADADLTSRLHAAEPPIVILHGDEDQRVPIEHSRGLGVPTLLHELVGVEHFALVDPLTPAWSVVRDALAAPAKA